MQCLASPLDKQCPQVAVTAPGDAAEALLTPGARLPWDQTSPGGHLPAIAEIASIGDRGDKCACGYRTDAGHRSEPLCGLALFGMQTNLRLAAGDLCIDSLKVFVGLLE